MKRIMEREKSLEEKLSGVFDEGKRTAAIAAATAVMQMPRYRKMLQRR
jgi:hypothetical protein